MAMRTIPDYAMVICMDDVKNCIGSLHSAILPEAVAFAGDVDMICKIHDSFDRIGRPQSTVILRKFVGDVPEYTSFNRHIVYVRTQEEVSAQRGAEDTAVLLMTSRKHAEWQGMLLDTEGNMRGRFSTMQECIAILKQE